MKKLMPPLILILVVAFSSFKQKATTKPSPITDRSSLIPHYSSPDTLLFPDETHFKNVQQLTFGGDNAEAYWSFDGKYIVFQRTNAKEGLKCDQIFYGKVPEKPGDKFDYKMISTGKGRTTCSFITKDGKHIIYASTHLGADTCPPVPDRSKYGNKYIWPLYDSYDIFMASLDGRIVKQLTHSKGYDAEGTLSPDGTKMIYTSDKDGDIDLYIMDINTGKEKKVYGPYGDKGNKFLVQLLTKAPNQFYHVSQIFIDTSVFRYRIADSLGNTILRKLKDSAASFEQLARTYSMGGEGGGDLGWIARGVMVPQIEHEVIAHKKGEVFRVWSANGLHIIRKMDNPKQDTGFALMMRIWL